MVRARWRWKKTRIFAEAAILGTMLGLLIILFTEAGVERQRNQVAPQIQHPPSQMKHPETSR
jgi:hypothetical protein